MFGLMFVLLTSSHAISCDDAARAVVGANDVRREFLDSAEVAAGESFWASFASNMTGPEDPKLRSYVMSFWTPVLNRTLAQVYDDDVTEVASKALLNELSCKTLKKAAKQVKKTDAFLSGDATNERDMAMAKAMTSLMSSPGFTERVAKKMMRAAESERDAFVAHMSARQ